MKLGLGLHNRYFEARKEIRYRLKNLRRPNLYDLKTPERVGCFYRQPSDMSETDRLMLFALVRGLRPALALEIGGSVGGSARIITNAMQENGMGRLIGIDPIPDTFRAKSSDLHARYTLMEGYSPQAIPAAAAKAGGKFDFVFVDALHIYDAALADFRGCLPHLADGAHVLFHDAYHQGLDQAIRDVLSENSELVDCGIITRNAPPTFPVTGQGLRLIRKGAVDSKRLISEVYERDNKTPPPFTRDVWNYDEAYNRFLSEKQERES
jgi:predicted O-methyltransferase YrrM